MKDMKDHVKTKKTTICQPSEDKSFQKSILLTPQSWALGLWMVGRRERRNNLLNLWYYIRGSWKKSNIAQTLTNPFQNRIIKKKLLMAVQENHVEIKAVIFITFTVNQISSKKELQQRFAYFFLLHIDHIKLKRCVAP